MCIQDTDLSCARMNSTNISSPPNIFFSILNKTPFLLHLSLFALYISHTCKRCDSLESQHHFSMQISFLPARNKRDSFLFCSVFHIIKPISPTSSYKANRLNWKFIKWANWVTVHSYEPWFWWNIARDVQMSTE